MASLTVRNLEDDVVRSLRIRAAEHGRSAEAEHRAILRAALTDASPHSLRVAAVERLAAFRRRTAGLGSARSAELLEASRQERTDQLTRAR